MTNASTAIRKQNLSECYRNFACNYRTIDFVHNNEYQDHNGAASGPSRMVDARRLPRG